MTSHRRLVPWCNLDRYAQTCCSVVLAPACFASNARVRSQSRPVVRKCGTGTTDGPGPREHTSPTRQRSSDQTTHHAVSAFVAAIGRQRRQNGEGGYSADVEQSFVGRSQPRDTAESGVRDRARACSTAKGARTRSSLPFSEGEKREREGNPERLQRVKPHTDAEKEPIEASR